jgi:UMF1 family MFS transporter
MVIWIVTIIFAFASSDQNSFVIQKLSAILNRDPGEVSRICFYIVGLLAGSVMGATQSTSRSLMSRLTPFDRKTEFFGFYSLFGKSSAIMGPLVFGYVSYVTGEQRFAILTICIFFVIGLGILSFVKDERIDAKGIEAN